SIPGGRIEPGETDAEAVVREMIEETGLKVQVGRLIGRVQRPGLNGAVIDIRDYAATVTGGTLRPGDDAADARWVAPAELASLGPGPSWPRPSWARPDARPLATMARAILCEASSIISSPSMTAPRACTPVA